jgi:hypothetical protein
LFWGVLEGPRCSEEQDGANEEKKSQDAATNDGLPHGANIEDVRDRGVAGVVGHEDRVARSLAGPLREETDRLGG